MPVLLLGGTADARELRDALQTASIEVIESVAGRTQQARDADARVGGYGGSAGLADYLRTADISAVVDATHPFAAQMTRNAAIACAQTGTPLLRLERTGWATHQDATGWHWVEDHAAAATQAASVVGPVLLTVGRQPLRHYLQLPQVIARVAEPDDTELPVGWQLIADRGPFELTDELDLLRSTGARVLVSKDSGGTSTAAKLDAARLLGVPVVMVRRPPTPDGVEIAADLTTALDWTRRHVSPGQGPPPAR